MSRLSEPSPPEGMDSILQSAARLQRVAPDAVMVGGSAASLYAHHRLSYDHDHVIADLRSRYDAVLEALDATDGWVLAQRYSKRPVTIMGSLDGVQAGVRQLRRTRPLEVQEVALASGGTVTVPVYEEIVRIKGWLVLQRSATRDYLDVAALAEVTSAAVAGGVLRGIDDYYEAGEAGLVSVLLSQQLASPSPRDPAVTHELASYQGLAQRWHDWANVVCVCRQIAREMI